MCRSSHSHTHHNRLKAIHHNKAIQTPKCTSRPRYLENGAHVGEFRQRRSLLSIPQRSLLSTNRISGTSVCHRSRDFEDTATCARSGSETDIAKSRVIQTRLNVTCNHLEIPTTICLQPPEIT